MSIFSRKKKSTEVSEEEILPKIIKPPEDVMLAIINKDYGKYNHPCYEHFNWVNEYLGLNLPLATPNNTPDFLVLVQAIMIKACKDYLIQDKFSPERKMKSKDVIGVVLNVNKAELFDEISEEMSIDEALYLVLTSYSFRDADLIVDQFTKILEDEDFVK